MKALGQALMDGYRFARVSATDVRIESPRGKSYTVVNGFCNCPDRFYRHRTCKHEKMCEELREFLEGL